MKIEEVQEITDQVEIVDGEEVYFLDKEMHAELEKLKQKIRLEKGSLVYEWLDNHMEFMCKHSGFALGFRPVKWGSDGKKWIPCMLYKFEGEWRRVILQYAYCPKCDWTGNIANPTDSDLYITMDNWLEISHKMWKLPFLNCPKCGDKISSQAIWLEDADIPAGFKEYLERF